MQGTLSTGREMAVKRLSKNSGQGLEGFMNEVVLIATFNTGIWLHFWVVALKEKKLRMLIYEYLPNKSLDHFIFCLSLLSLTVLRSL